MVDVEKNEDTTVILLCGALIMKNKIVRKHMSLWESD